MIGPAHTTDPADARAAAAWYAKRTPARGTPSADSALLAKGDALYARGDPATGVIACQDCHGRDGRGIGDMPALAGQHAAYLERQLRAFTDGTRPLGVTMHGIARGLSAEERSAVAAYAQSLPAGAAR
jgi:cytochrome c553